MTLKYKANKKICRLAIFKKLYLNKKSFQILKNKKYLIKSNKFKINKLKLVN